MAKCPVCNGSGLEIPEHEIVCSLCGGQGVVLTHLDLIEECLLEDEVELDEDESESK